jgi:hypothetical protein
MQKWFKKLQINKIHKYSQKKIKKIKMETYPYLLLPFVEIEVRLGTLTKKQNGGTFFDTSIDKKYFQEILSVLESGIWNSVENTKSIEYYSKPDSQNSKNKTRLIESTNGNKIVMKENININTIILNNSPFDIRYSINQEFSLNSYSDRFSKKDCTIRNKTRKSFISDNFRYDLTYVIETINNIEREKYEIELELLQNKNTLTWSTKYINDFMECKVYDLVNIVEKIDRESFNINFIKD